MNESLLVSLLKDSTSQLDLRWESHSGEDFVCGLIDRDDALACTRLPIFRRNI